MGTVRIRIDYQTKRSRFLESARKLARSGQHADHRSILAALKASPDYPLVQKRLEDPVFQEQLNRLCAIAVAKAHKFA